VGGSIGTAALSTVALTATASYLTAHHTGPLAAAAAAVQGYRAALLVSAILLGVGALTAVLLLPSRARLEELRNMAAMAEAEPAFSVAPAASVASAAAPGSAASGAPAASPARTDSVSAGDGGVSG
jgi:hypothetical protein